jgi:UDP-2,4-diacetamido-2,4,6-trideoxy-beta-L-altropyranose hydrolase
MSLRVAFRADASVQMGIGHVMRCLTLADSVAAQGGSCLFLCRPFEGHMIDAIRQRGHRAEALPLTGDTAYGLHPSPPPHADWLGGDWRSDAAATRTAVTDFVANWLVVDHYALDRDWQATALPGGSRLAVIDDLADRPHLADLLLDQNYGRKASDYDGLETDTCQRLIGPRFALLRPRFAELREQALERRATAQPRHLLITLGGTDPKNATGAVLRALADLDLPEGMRITVVMGANAPWLADVKTAAKALPCPTEVLVNVADMAGLMLHADFCIGAAGSTTWERCCLGLPMALLVLAENQRPSAEALSRDGVCMVLPSPSEPAFHSAMVDLVTQMATGKTSLALAKTAAAICDGAGTTRLLRALSRTPISLRPASPDDCAFVLHCRNDGEAWRYYKTPKPTEARQHNAWFSKALNRDDLWLGIAEKGATPVGFVRLDFLAQGRAEVGIALAEKFRGEGLGEILLRAAIAEARTKDITQLDAVVHVDNTASMALFRACGFRTHGQDGQFAHMDLPLPTPTTKGHDA